jgi:hypothetical protein
MSFVRKVADSEILANIIDIPESLRNKKVEILIFPYEEVNAQNDKGYKPKKARGLLEKYKNEKLRVMEGTAWAKAVVDKYENRVNNP